jgi:hypothetical protein
MLILHELVSIFGVPGTIVLITIFLLVGLGVLYLVLQFGEKGLGLLPSFALRIVEVLAGEFKSKQPAIRVERIFTFIFLTVFLLTFAEVALHSLFPWIRHEAEYYFLLVSISCFLVLIALAWVSVKLSLRLPPD